MIAVIIAGGSGTRLWPLSTSDYPKHLLNIDGGQDSLLQSTYDRARLLGDAVYVLTEAGHVQHVKDQLPGLNPSNFIVEPARRGTASCIVQALVEISKQHDHAEPIAFMHADHFIRDKQGFAETVKRAAEVSTANNRLVLIGISPEYPASSFGYIKKGQQLDGSETFKVDGFKEKPDKATAETYLASGNYLWNGGYFVASINTFLREMQEFAPELRHNYDRLLVASQNKYEQTYLGFENIAIDYALIEKVSDLLVIPAQFDWMDVGSFNDLHAVLESDERGNATLGNVELESVSGSIIQNYEDKPIAVIGLDNIAVINTPKGIVITHKDSVQKVGEISKRLTPP